MTPVTTRVDNSTVTTTIVRNTAVSMFDTAAVYAEFDADGAHRFGVSDSEHSPPDELLEMTDDQWAELYRLASDFSDGDADIDGSYDVTLTEAEVDYPRTEPWVTVQHTASGATAALSSNEVERLEQFFEDAAAFFLAQQETT